MVWFGKLQYFFYWRSGWIVFSIRTHMKFCKYVLLKWSMIYFNECPWQLGTQENIWFYPQSILQLSSTVLFQWSMFYYKWYPWQLGIQENIWFYLHLQSVPGPQPIFIYSLLNKFWGLGCHLISIFVNKASFRVLL